MTTSIRIVLLSLLVSSLVFGPFGCGESLESLTDRLPAHDDDEIRLAVLGMQQGSLETALLVALAGEVSMNSGESAMASEAAAKAKDIFSPEDCVDAIATGPAVSLVFRECAGPFGIVGLDGGANLSFAGEGDSAAVILTAGSLDVNGTSLALNVSGLMSENDENVRSFELQTSGGGVADGEPITRVGQFMARLDGDCLVLNGHWTATRGGTVFPTSFTGFKRCSNPCPTAGTMVLGEAGVDSGERALTLTFVGTQTVAWVSTDQRVGTTTLQCGEAE
ncbi:MAG: hypothetical protein ACNA8W_13005 [Bradymonadaceae bacterium]